MTWNETHERTRIIRIVEAAAAADTVGRLPWQDSWAPYFGSPEGLLAMLRARWEQTCRAQVDASAGEEAFREAYDRLRTTHAGVLRVLEAHGALPTSASAVTRSDLGVVA